MRKTHIFTYPEFREPYRTLFEHALAIEAGFVGLLSATGPDRSKDNPNLVDAIHYAGQARIAFEKYATELKAATESVSGANNSA